MFNLAVRMIKSVIQ